MAALRIKISPGTPAGARLPSSSRIAKSVNIAP
jgi:hypothetical protein